MLLRNIEKKPKKGLLRRLRKNKSGLALVEFAGSLPIFFGLGFFGLEIVNLAITNMLISQAALNLADNASRLGQTNGSVITPTINETDLIRTFRATSLQTESIELLSEGRVILSSLERNAGDDPVIRWQRCKGTMNVISSYGVEGRNGTMDASFVGMGPAGGEIAPAEDSAVMFVEVFYQYNPVFGNLFLSPRTIRSEAALDIRDRRNLPVGLANDSPNAPTCDKFDDTF